MEETQNLNETMDELECWLNSIATNVRLDGDWVTQAYARGRSSANVSPDPENQASAYQRHILNGSLTSCRNFIFALPSQYSLGLS